MATEIAKAYVQIVPSAKGMEGQLNKEMDVAGGKAGEIGGSSLGKSLIKVVGALGIGAAIGKSISVGSELEQNLGGTEAVFGKFAKSIQDSAQVAYKNMGLSASDYMATANKMGSLFQGSGIEQQKALQMTTDAMQRASDVASVMGLDMQSAMESVAGMAKGNFTMMDNLGVAMNATTLQAYALEKGVNFNWNTASNAEKEALAMEMFMDRTSQYAGNFARESEETFSGSLDAMKSSLNNVLGSLSTGTGLPEALNAFLETARIFLVNNFLPMIQNVISGFVSSLPSVINDARGFLSDLIFAISDMVSEVGGQLSESFPEIIENIVIAISSLAEDIMITAPQFLEAGLQILVALIDGIVNNIPLLIGGVENFIYYLSGTILDSIPIIIDAGKQLLGGLIEAIPTIIDTLSVEIPYIVDVIVGTIVVGLPLLIEGAIELFNGIVEAIPIIIPVIVSALPKIIDSIVGGLLAVQSTLIEGAVQLFMAIIKAIPLIVVSILQATPQLVQAIVKGLLGSIALLNNAVGTLGRTIVNGIKNLISSMRASGGELITGLWNGINDKISWITNKIRGFGNSVMSAIKGIFGIKSPSRRMKEEVGKNIALGMAEGITDNLSFVEDAMNELSGVGSLDSTFKTDISTNGGIVKDSVKNISVNVYGTEGMDEETLANKVINRLTNLYIREALA